MASIWPWSWFWSGVDREAFDPLCSDAKDGFVQIDPVECRTRTIAEYETQLSGAEHWREFEQGSMDKYYDDDIHMFPYVRSEAGARKSASREMVVVADDQRVRPHDPLRELMRRTLGWALPDRFFEIQTQMIERRFPGGRNKTIGDGDVRDVVSGLRYVFTRNFWRLIVARRALAAVVSLVILIAAAAISLAVKSAGVQGATIVNGVPDLILFAGGGSFVVLAILVGYTFFRYSWLRERYENALKKSCSNTRGVVQLRFHDLIALIPLIFARVDTVKLALHEAGRLKEWPTEARKWSKLSLWMAMRVQYLEYFMQVEMWRIRRSQSWMRLLGLLLTALSTFASLSLLGILMFVLTLSTAGTTLAALLLVSGLAAAALLWVNYASYSLYLPSPDLIQDNLKTENMQGSNDSKLHDELADLMSRMVSTVLREEDKISGKNH